LGKIKGVSEVERRRIASREEVRWELWVGDREVMVV
jgi:hypothetical protein